MNKKPNLFNQVIISSIEDYKNKIETLTKQKERLIRRDKKHREEIERLHSIIKEVREEMENAKHISVEDVYHIIEHEKKLNEILDKVEENSNE